MSVQTLHQIKTVSGGFIIAALIFLWAFLFVKARRKWHRIVLITVILLIGVIYLRYIL